MTDTLSGPSLLLTVVIGLPGENSQALLDVARSIAAQSVASRIELIICAAARELVPFTAADLPELADVRVIEVGPFQTFAEGIVTGIGHARAGVVVLFEDHVFAAPGWAEAVVGAHARGYAAVGPSMENANPWSGRSWTHLLYDYGRFLCGEPAGEKDDLPGHNSSYHREVLIAYPPRRLRELIGSYQLHADLKRGGHRLYLSGDAVCWHQNPSKFFASIWIRYTAHRHRAGARAEAERWSTGRRLCYAMAWPLIPFVRVRDVWTNLRRQKRTDLLKPNIIAAVCFFSVSNAFGEMIGFLFGTGDVDAALSTFEFARHRQMCAGDLVHPPAGAAHRAGAGGRLY